MKFQLFIILLLLISGCSVKRSKHKINEYGFEKFSSEALTFRETGKLPKTISVLSKSDQAENYLNGVLIIISESERTKEGIFVAPNISGFGGSGLEITPWSDNVSWVEIKKRKISNKVIDATP